MYDDEVEFVQVNAYDRVGQTLAQRFQLRITPTMVYFDASGAEIARDVARISETNVRRLVDE